jgi:hypothetical protein
MTMGRLALGLGLGLRGTGGNIVPHEPGQFHDTDWTVSDAGVGETATLTIDHLPSTGGSPITDIEYQLDGGSWVSTGLDEPGDFDITGLTDDQTYAVAIRAVNAIGNGPASDTKNVTPTAGYTPSLDFSDARNSQYFSLI